MLVSHFLLPRSGHRINGRCGHLYTDTYSTTPFPCPFTVDRPFLRDTSQHSACASHLTSADTNWTLPLIIPAFSLYVCRMYKGRTALHAFQDYSLLGLAFSVSDSFSLPFHRPSVYGPELCWYPGGEDHANRRRCLLGSAEDRLKVSV